jgi:hypothetical protein
MGRTVLTESVIKNRNLTNETRCECVKWLILGVDHIWQLISCCKCWPWVLQSDFDRFSVQVNPYYLWAVTHFINFPVIDRSQLQVMSSCELHTVQTVAYSYLYLYQLCRYYANTYLCCCSESRIGDALGCLLSGSVSFGRRLSTGCICNNVKKCDSTIVQNGCLKFSACSGYLEPKQFGTGVL